MGAVRPAKRLGEHSDALPADPDCRGAAGGAGEQLLDSLDQPVADPAPIAPLRNPMPRSALCSHARHPAGTTAPQCRLGPWRLASRAPQAPTPRHPVVLGSNASALAGQQHHSCHTATAAAPPPLPPLPPAVTRPLLPQPWIARARCMQWCRRTLQSGRPRPGRQQSSRCACGVAGRVAGDLFCGLRLQNRSMPSHSLTGPMPPTCPHTRNSSSEQQTMSSSMHSWQPTRSSPPRYLSCWAAPPARPLAPLSRWAAPAAAAGCGQLRCCCRRAWDGRRRRRRAWTCGSCRCALGCGRVAGRAVCEQDPALHCV